MGDFPLYLTPAALLQARFSRFPRCSRPTASGCWALAVVFLPVLFLVLLTVLNRFRLVVMLVVFGLRFESFSLRRWRWCLGLGLGAQPSVQAPLCFVGVATTARARR